MRAYISAIGVALGMADSCTDACRVGAKGLGHLLPFVQSSCSSYAARVVDADTAQRCGHAALSAALANCIGNEQLPPQCFKHESVGELYAVATTVVAIIYWLPLVAKLLQLR